MSNMTHITDTTSTYIDPSRMAAKAMLVSLSIKKPSNSKKDKDASLEVTTGHQADESAARVNKTLFSKAAVKPFSEPANAARKKFYELTLPWADGVRILKADNYYRLVEEMDKYRDRFEDGKEKFKQAYLDHKEEARRLQGTLFKEEDYVNDISELDDEFSFQVSFQPLAQAADWRVELASDEVAKIKQQMEQQTRTALAEACREPLRRLADVVGKMAEKLREVETKPADQRAWFKDSLVGNIANLCEIMPALNLAEDPRIDQLASEVRDQLASRTPQELRTDPAVLRETRQHAEGLVSRIEALAGTL